MPNDAHLHPEWQREIGFWLKHHFPKIQFLVTTHSPLVCQAADPMGLFVLPEPGSMDRARQLSPDEHRRIIAARPETILLTKAFGLTNTRSDLAVAQRKVHASLSAKQRGGGTMSGAEQRELKQASLS